MAFTQMQLIQSLGEAMAWFERELNWGVPEQELRHLSGRIGELYAAVITNGQMALAVNQRGYDVVSSTGERISVKTITSSSHVSLNAKTLTDVDRLIVLKINTEEMQVETLLDATIAEALTYATDANASDRLIISLSRLQKKAQPKNDIAQAQSVVIGDYTVSELENGTIEVSQNGKLMLPAKPVLRQLAQAANISLLNSNGNPLNTRQLGSLLIKSVND